MTYQVKSPNVKVGSLVDTTKSLCKESDIYSDVYGKVYSIVKEEVYYLVNIYNFENLELITLLNNNNFFINDNTKIIAKK